MGNALSCYILTYNSGRYLAQVMEPLLDVVDDFLIFDSGSTDGTEAIAKKYGARFLVRPFDNFKDQRNAALEACRFNWVLNFDSDEIADAKLVAALTSLKQDNFELSGEVVDAFRITRDWYLFGKKVRCFYPISAPDYPIRLFRKDKVHFGKNSKRVHEHPEGFDVLRDVPAGVMEHYSCDSADFLFNKLNGYTAIAAQDLKAKGKKATWRRIILSPFAAFVKWYIVKGGWKDGAVGFLLGVYAFDYTLKKYLKLKFEV